MTNKANKTADHAVIRKWIEERGGAPATVKETASGEEAGVLRFAFTESRKDSLERISREDFFDKFKKEKLAFLYQDETQSGEQSRFFKFVNC